MRRIALCVLAVLAGATLSCAGDESVTPPPPEANPALSVQESGTSQLLQAVSAVDDSVVWVSGHGGTYARTLNGGATWAAGMVPGGDTLQFRDVHAFDAETAYLLGAGPGDMSRIYRTSDGGATWDLQWVNDHPDGFYDCIDFWDRERGAVYGDEVDGRFSILTTADGGASWNHVPAENLPPVQESEGGFAASGLCLVTGPDGLGWIATGAADTARVLRTEDYGQSWQAVVTPVAGGEAAGLTAVAFRGGRHGIVLGGDIAAPDGRTDNVAVSHDGGATWNLAGRPTFPGAFYGGVYVPGIDAAWVVGVGPGGADYSVDNGLTWTPLDTLTYWAVGFASPAAGWMVGPGGRITKVQMF
jgi:photosystem II stability/assembly factor-like uncharacterized protein